MKNFVVQNGSLTGTTTELVLAEAQDSAVLAVAQDVEKGCSIKAMHIDIDVCGLGGTGVQNVFDGYLFKNPGSNLGAPDPSNWGVSNEKKFIFHTMNSMIMRNQDGNNVVRFSGWIKVPKRYQRMGANDKISLIHRCTTALTGHISTRVLYKWYK